MRAPGVGGSRTSASRKNCDLFTRSLHTTTSTKMMMEDPPAANALFTELPVPLLSTAALIRHQQTSTAPTTLTRYQPYHPLTTRQLHQPQHFHSPAHELQHLKQRLTSDAFEDGVIGAHSTPQTRLDLMVDDGGRLMTSTRPSNHHHHSAHHHHHHHLVTAGVPQPVEVDTTHISRLYPEILAIIFGYLEVRDKGRAAQVCTTWRDAAYRKSVWRGVEARLHLRRGANPALFSSLVRRGIKRVQVLSLRKSLRDVVHGVPTLEALNLSGCYNVADVGISHAFVADTPCLTHLDLSLCKQVTDNALSKIAQYARNLEVLELGGCSNVTNTGLVLIAWGLKKLKRLNLRSCWHVSDQGISHLALGNPCLEYLGLQDCQRLTDEALKHATGLQRLTAINLSFCVSITDSGLKHLTRMTSLRELNLRSCDNVSDIGMAYLAEGGSKITSLDVSFCDKIGDLALVHISQGLFQLRSLSLSACHISDDGLVKIAGALHDLETLNIGQCSRVSDKGLHTISEALTRLKCIDLYGCTRITTAGLERVMKLPQLSVLNLGLWHVR